MPAEFLGTNIMSHKLQPWQFQFLKQARTKRSPSLSSLLLNSKGSLRDRQTCYHVIGPLNDITAENLGQRGRRAGELACRADTRGRPLQHGLPAGITSSEMEASRGAETCSHFPSLVYIKKQTDFKVEFRFE